MVDFNIGFKQLESVRIEKAKYFSTTRSLAEKLANLGEPVDIKIQIPPELLVKAQTQLLDTTGEL